MKETFLNVACGNRTIDVLHDVSNSQAQLLLSVNISCLIRDYAENVFGCSLCDLRCNLQKHELLKILYYYYITHPTLYYIVVQQTMQ